MNSPTQALLWELWRRNRLGFAILLGLFAVCVGLTELTETFAKKAAFLEAHNPNVFTLSGDQMLVSSPTGREPGRVLLQLKRTIIFDDLVLPGDQFTITGIFAESGGPAWRITLHKGNSAWGFTGERWTYDGQSPLNPTLSWTAADGRTGTFTPAFDPDYPAAVALARSRAEQWRGYVLAWSVGLFAFSVFTLFAIFGVAEPTAARGFTGIPPRRFTLPVGTGPLVGWPMATGCAMIGLTYLAWSQWVLQPLTAARGPMPDGYLLLLLCAGLTCFQAVVWTLPSFPKTRALLLTALVLALFVFAALGFDRGMDESAPVLSGLFAVALVISAFLGLIGVRLERRGFWTGWIRSDVGTDSFRLVLPRTVRFAGPLHAQCWMEWRRNGRFAAGLFVFLFGLIAASAIASPFGSERVQMLAGALMPLSVIATVGWVGISGLNLARDGASKALALSSFTAVRPVPTGALVEAKLTVGLFVWGIFALGLSFVWVVITLLGPGRGGDSVVVWAVLMALSAHFFVGILPVCLAGRMAGFPWSLLPWLLVYGALANVAIWFGEHPTHLGKLFWLLAAGLVLKLASAAVGFSRSLRAGLISAAFVGVYAGAWVVATAALVRIVSLYVDRLGWAESDAWIPGMALVLPLARIAWAPVALAHNRHR